jgi:hypothetical protein
MFQKCSALFLHLGEHLVHAPYTKVSSAVFPICGDVPQDGRCKDHFGFVSFHLYCFIFYYLYVLFVPDILTLFWAMLYFVYLFP